MQATLTGSNPIADTSGMPAGIDIRKMRDLREARGLTLEQSAKRAGIGMSHWADLEAGRRSGNVKLATLYAIAAALECRPADLLLPED